MSLALKFRKGKVQGDNQREKLVKIIFCLKLRALGYLRYLFH